MEGWITEAAMTGMIDASVTRTHVDARDEGGTGGREWRVVHARWHRPLLAMHVVTTVGVLVGHGGLGQLIYGGFNANFYRAEIVTGAVGCVLLALVADVLLAGAERLVTPWARAVRS